MNLTHLDEFIYDLLYSFSCYKCKSIYKHFGDKFYFITKINKPIVYKLVFSDIGLSENIIKISRGMETFRYVN